MLTLLLSAALAADPVAVVTDAGLVRGTVSVPVPAAVVVGQLADPGWVATLYDGGTEVSVVGPDGDCLVVDYVSPSAFLAVKYKVRHCPTRTGTQATLLESNAFSSYGTTWRVEPTAAGSNLVYELELVTTLMVPQSFVRSATRKSVQKLMEALDGWGAAWAGAHGAAAAP